MIITVALEGSLLLSVLGVGGGGGGGGGGGYSIYGPNNYVPPIRVLFLRVRTLNRVSFLPILASCSPCFP